MDIKITGGTLIDGSGGAGIRLDVGIMDEKIAQIGNLSQTPARREIDASGRVVCPGFIDMHTHSDMTVLYDSLASSKLCDGVTTEVVGNCGIGVAPVKEERKEQLIGYLGTRLIGSIPVKLELPWNTMAEYLAYIDAHPAAVNVTPLLAQGAVRIGEMGFSNAEPTERQIENMKAEVTKAMQAGCAGLSTGLVYMPGEYTTSKELVALCSALVPFGGFYVTHIRNESDEVFEALEEAIGVATAAGVPLQISHLKLAGIDVQGRSEALLARIDKARAEGLEISFDVYPYTAGLTSLGAFMPPWTFEGGTDNMIRRLADPDVRRRIVHDIENGIKGWQNFGRVAVRTGGWDNIILVSAYTEAGKALAGRTVGQIAHEQGKDPYDAMFDLLIQESGRIQITFFSMLEDDVARIISHPLAMIGSDGVSLSTQGLLSYGKPHPRAFGTHARVLARYVREKGLITLEEAVKKMTSMPAEKLRLSRRGLLREGYYADILVLDPENVQDMATFEAPQQYSKGFDYILVNGQIALQDGVQTDAVAGRVVGAMERRA